MKMNKYISTFYSHFGAMTYQKAITNQGINAKLMPVPRKVSSSCGTCVYYEHLSAVDINDCELECIYMVNDDVFECVLKK